MRVRDPSQTTCSLGHCSRRQGRWTLHANLSLVVSILHSLPTTFWVLGSLRPTLQPPTMAVCNFIWVFMRSMSFHFQALHRLDHSQWMWLPWDRAKYATTNPPKCCLRASLCFSFKSWTCWSLRWFKFCMGEKAPHSVEIQTCSGLPSSTNLRTFLRPSGVVRSHPLNSPARSARKPCFLASLVKVELSEHATSRRNNLFILATLAHCSGSILLAASRSWLPSASVKVWWRQVGSS